MRLCCASAFGTHICRQVALLSCWRLAYVEHVAQDLPLLFPSVLAFRLCMAVMAAPAFPLSVLGGVLSSYSAAQLRAVPAAEPLAFRYMLGQCSLCLLTFCQFALCSPAVMRPKHQVHCCRAELRPELRTTATGNAEYDIVVSVRTTTGNASLQKYCVGCVDSQIEHAAQEVVIDSAVGKADCIGAGELVWQDCSTFTVMAGSRKAQQRPQEADAAAAAANTPVWRPLAEWYLGSEVGRRFAAVNGGASAIHYTAHVDSTTRNCCTGISDVASRCAPLQIVIPYT